MVYESPEMAFDFESVKACVIRDFLGDGDTGTVTAGFGHDSVQTWPSRQGQIQPPSAISRRSWSHWTESHLFHAMTGPPYNTSY